jgi:phosphohistidine phosphatase
MSGQTFINAIKKLDNKKSSVILFGHEPTISEFAAYLVKSFRQGIPKAGIIGIDIESSSWVNIAKEKGTIKFVQYPKSISEAQQLMKKSIAVKIEAEISKLLENVDAETAGRVSKSVKKSSKEITKIFLKKYQKKQQEKKPSKP